MLTASRKIMHPFHTDTFQSGWKITDSILFLLLHSSILRYSPMSGKIHTYYRIRHISCDSCCPHRFSFFLSSLTKGFFEQCKRWFKWSCQLICHHFNFFPHASKWKLVLLLFRSSYNFSVSQCKLGSRLCNANSYFRNANFNTVRDLKWQDKDTRSNYKLLHIFSGLYTV